MERVKRPVWVWVHHPKTPYWGRRYKADPTEKKIFLCKPPQEEKVAIGIHPNAIEILSKNLYSGDIPNIVFRELIQNAIDSLRGVDNPTLSLKLVGDPILDKDIYFIIEDNGIGMTPQVVREAFSQVGGSYKVQAEATGGFGFGKLSFFAAAEELEVLTVAKEANKTYKTTLKGKDILENGFQMIVEEVNPNTPTGTKVTFKPSKRFQRYYFNYAWHSWKNDLPYAILPNIKVFFDDKPLEFEDLGKPIATKKVFDPNTSKEICELNIYLSRQTTTKQTYDLQLLNNGFPQKTKTEMYHAEFVDPPERIIVDVKTTLSPQDENYPWTLNRENLKAEVDRALKETIKQEVMQNLVKRETGGLLALFKKAPETKGNIKVVAGQINPEGTEKLKVEAKALLNKLLETPAGQKVCAVYAEVVTSMAEMMQKYLSKIYSPAYSEPIKVHLAVSSNFRGLYAPAGTLLEDSPVILISLPYFTERLSPSLTGDIPQNFDSRIAETVGNIQAVLLHELIHHREKGHAASFASTFTSLYGTFIGKGWSNILLENGIKIFKEFFTKATDEEKKEYFKIFNDLYFYGDLMSMYITEGLKEEI